MRQRAPIAAYHRTAHRLGAGSPAFASVALDEALQGWRSDVPLYLAANTPRSSFFTSGISVSVTPTDLASVLFFV